MTGRFANNRAWRARGAAGVRTRFRGPVVVASVLALAGVGGCASGSASEAPIMTDLPARAPSDPSPAVRMEASADLDFGNAEAGAPAPAPASTGGRCAPGHYIGTFSGMYRSAAWGNGTAPVGFATADVNGRPGFEFWLEAVESECVSNEFCVGAVVKGGKLRGYATPFADPSAPEAMAAGFSVRFEIDLSGELDCTTGTFRGVLDNGCYDIASVLYRFDGTLMSNYDVMDSRFFDGSWQAKEQPMTSLFAPDPNIGGDGEWDAQFADDSQAPTGAAIGLCDGASGFDTPMQ